MFWIVMLAIYVVTATVAIIFISIAVKQRKDYRQREEVVIKEVEKIALEKTEEISRLREAVARAEDEATKDGLTGLLNQKNISLKLKEELKRAHRFGRNLWVMFMDIDNLKKINEKYGHSVGTQVIKKVSEVIRYTLKRDSDMIGRYGGDEFTVILPEASEVEVSRLAKEIIEKTEGMKIEGLNLASLCIGIKEFDPISDDIVSLIDKDPFEEVSLAMLDAKRVEGMKIKKI